MNTRKTEILKLRSEGLSLAKIGDRYGISRQRVYNILYPGIRQEKRRDAYIFPNIAQWMNDNGESLTSLSKTTGYDISSVGSYLRGVTAPHYNFILAILQLTGMTFEEAFKRKEE